MAKRLSEKQKNQIINEFYSGKTIDNLANKFNFTKLTISRNLKKNLGEKKYNEIISKNRSKSKTSYKKNISFISKSQVEQIQDNKNNSSSQENIISEESLQDQFKNDSRFFEITPLIHDIDNISQKDLASIAIADIDFPKVVFMIINKKIELEIKYLKEYPEWSFLSEKDLNRKTIEVFFDVKNAKRKCGEDNKVIKVPNTRVFKIVAPILLSRGITRIISENQLISL